MFKININKKYNNRIFLLIGFVSFMSLIYYICTISYVHAGFNFKNVITDMAKTFVEQGRLGLLRIKWLEETLENFELKTRVLLTIKDVKEKIKNVNDMVDTFKPVYSIFQGFGVLMVTMNLMLYLIRELQKPDPDQDVWLRFYIMYAISFMIILNIDYVFDGINTAMRHIVDLVMDSFTKPINGVTLLDKILESRTDVVLDNFENESILEEFADISYFEYKSRSVELISCNLCSLILGAFADCIVYAMAIKMILRRMFAPIAMSDMASEGFRSPGVKYMKRYVAYYLQEIIIIFIYAVYVILMSIVQENSTQDVMVAFWLQIALMGALCAVLTNSNSMANEILGIG